MTEYNMDSTSKTGVDNTYSTDCEQTSIDTGNAAIWIGSVLGVVGIVFFILSIIIYKKSRK